MKEYKYIAKFVAGFVCAMMILVIGCLVQEVISMEIESAQMISWVGHHLLAQKAAVVSSQLMGSSVVAIVSAIVFKACKPEEDF